MNYQSKAFEGNYYFAWVSFKRQHHDILFAVKFMMEDFTWSHNNNNPSSTVYIQTTGHHKQLLCMCVITYQALSIIDQNSPNLLTKPFNFIAIK